MSDKVQALARVQITVEFAIGGGAWSSDRTIEQINAEARENALQILRRGLIVEGLMCHSPSKTHATIVGEPKITAILVEKQS
jgi:hypothetical protein